MRSSAILAALALLAGCGASASPPGPGTAATDLLAADPFVVEVRPVEHQVPVDQAVAFLRARLAPRVRHLTIVWGAPFPRLGRPASTDDLRALVLASGHVVLLLPDGTASAGEAGVALTPRACAVFAETANGRQDLVGHAMLHEVGHLLGLVTALDHADPASAGHDRDPLCVMHRDCAGDDFCVFCRRDLTARGGL